MEPSSEAVAFKPGDSVTCTIEAPEPGGYLVSLIPSGIKGFLPSRDELDLGQTVPTTFICMNGDKALLAYAFMIGTTERIQLSTASDNEIAFSVWADSYPRSERLKRAVDLFMPPLEGVPQLTSVDPQSADKFIKKLEDEKFTGCLKMDSDSQPSRSAALFFQGRAVGAIYTKKGTRDPFPFEASLKLMLADLHEGNSEVFCYSLPAEFVVPVSALFLGVMVDKPESAPNREYFEGMIAQFKERKLTACFALQESDPCAVAMVFRGDYKGAYSVEEREFSPDKAFAKELIDQYTNAKLVAIVLPDAITSGSMMYGYSLLGPPFVVA